MRKAMVFLRPLTFSKDKISLRVRPLRGKYQTNNKKITFQEEGCVILDLTDQMKDHEGTVQVNYSGKLSYKLNMSQISNFLGLNIYSKEPQSFEIQYSKTLENEKKVLSVQSDPKTKEFQLEIKSMEKDGGNSKGGKLINLSQSEMLIFLESLKFALPYMNGWYALQSYSLIKTDLEENLNVLKKQLDQLDNAKSPFEDF